MAHKHAKPTKSVEIPEFVTVRQRASKGDDIAIFQHADKIPGSQLPSGSSFTVNAFSGEANGVEFTSKIGTSHTTLEHNNGALYYSVTDDGKSGSRNPIHYTNSQPSSGEPRDPRYVHYKDAPIEHNKQYGFVTKTAADIVGHAMNAAVVRAFKDRKFTQQEVLQFERARKQIVESISDGDLTAIEAHNIVKTLNAIAPEKNRKK